MTTPQGPTAKARKCSGCGESLNSGDSFCANCGASVTACPSCGYGLQPGDRFCPQCGYRMPGGTVAGPSKPISAWDRVLQRLRTATMGEFEIQRELGRGGMAAVYLGHELALNRKVAIKVMSPSLLMGQGMVDRFRQEAITVANLNHQNIVTIHAVRQFEDLHYFVMQFVAGCSLETIIRHHQSLPVPVVRAALFQVGSALAHAHSQGVVHRDIKPGNILCNKDGMAIVTDFGIAKVMESPSQTQTGVLVGTPAYMSPEQCKTGHVTWASDQYSLGVVAYEMVTGKSPFTGPTMTVMHAHVHDPVPSMLDVRPDIPPELDEAIRRMLAKEPEERWPSMGAALRGLGAMPLLPGDPILQEMADLVQQHQAHPSLPTTPVSPILRSRAPATAGTAVPASVSVLQAPESLELGDQVQLNAAVLSGAGVVIKDADVTWSSSDARVAAIDPTSGILIATAEGTATITAAAGKVETAVQVSVTPRQPAEVVVTAPKAWLSVDEPLILSASVRDRSGHELEGAPSWSTSDPSVAAVSDRGVVTGHAPGPVAITAQVGWVKGSISLTVGEAAVAGVQLSVPPRSVTVGETFRLTATPLDGRDMPMGGRPAAAWVSSDPAVATVSADGVVSALAPGSVSITATVEGATASVTVSISGASVAAVRVSEPPRPVAVGEPFTLQASIVGPRGQAMQVPVDWSSDDPAVAAVSATGTVTPRGPGRAVITATAAGMSGSAVVTVPDVGSPVAKRAPAGRSMGLAWLWVAIPVLILAVAAVLWFRRGRAAPTPAVTVASVTVTPQGGTLSLGDSVSLVAVVRDASDSLLADAAPTWSSSDPTVAEVDPAGLVRARGIGQATITATVEGTSAAAAFTVSATVEPVAAVRLADHPTRLEEGGRLRLEAVVTSASGSALAGRPVVWASDNTAVAQVDPSTGEVTGRAAGRATIRATVDGTSAATVITVAPPAPARLVVEPRNLVVTLGEGRSILASVRDASGRTLDNAPITYRSGDDGVARVDNRGRITTVGVGATNISVTSGSLSATVAIVVNGAARTPVAVVKIAQTDTTLLPGQKLTLRAATADAKGAGLGRAVQWSSTNDAVARVDGQGSVTARAEGTAFLVAVSEGVRDSIRVAVAAPSVTPDTGRGPPGPPAVAAEEQFKAQVADYLKALAGGDKVIVQQLFLPQSGDDTKRMQKLVEAMDRRDFGVTPGDPTPTSAITGDQARVEFTQELTWRGNFGGSTKKDVRFIAVFQRSGTRWTLTAMRTAPDTDL